MEIENVAGDVVDLSAESIVFYLEQENIYST